MTGADSGDVEIRIGVLLAESEALSADGAEDLGLDDSGHAPAWGDRGRRLGGNGRVACVGSDLLRAAGAAVGREVAVVMGGVVAGVERSGGIGEGTGSFELDTLELTFGVTATLGAGKAVEAFLSASGEATVEVRLTLRQRVPGRQS